MTVNYLKYNQIDFEKWDNRISESVSGDIYGFSWYLDALYKKWDALVLNDYEAIMPVPVKRNMVLSYVKQSVFAFKTGVYSKNAVSRQIVELFLKSVPSNIFFINIDIENYNIINRNFVFGHKKIYQLDLISPYETILGNFSQNIKNIINQLNEEHYSYVSGLMPNDLISLVLRTETKSKKNIDKIRLFVATAMRHRLGQIYAAYDRYNNISSAAVFVSSHYKTNIICVFTEKNKSAKKSLVGLINFYIKNNSGKPVTLFFPVEIKKYDSDLFSGFGAKQKIMTNVRYKKLYIAKRFILGLKQSLSALFS